MKGTQQAAVKTVGMKNKNRKTDNEKIRKLSDEQKQLRIQLNNTDNKKKEKCEQLRRERNKKMAEIHSEIKKQEDTMLEQKLEKMKNNKNNERNESNETKEATDNQRSRFTKYHWKQKK